MTWSTLCEITQVQIIASCPSIEFWLLLHFEYSTRFFQNAAEAQEARRAHLPDYRKNDRDIFGKTAAGLDMACQRAAQLKADLRATGAIGPDTDMASLVGQLQRMQRV